MTPGAELTSYLDRLSVASPQQVALRGAVAVATVAFLALVVVAGGPFHPVLSLLLVLVAGLAVTLPDSSAPLFLVLGLAALWWVSVPDVWSAWTLVAGVLLLVLHLAATLCSYGPPALRLDRRLLRTWAGRAVVMLAATTLVWLAVGFLGTLDLPPSGTVLLLALALVTGWVALLASRLATRDAEPSR